MRNLHLRHLQLFLLFFGKDCQRIEVKVTKNISTIWPKTLAKHTRMFQRKEGQVHVISFVKRFLNIYSRI
jgi:hypothetical protein